MHISRDEARRIARLAHLEFDEAGLDRMAADMTEILGYIDQLRSVDAGAIDETPAESLTMREDAPRPGVDRELAAANAPSFRDGFFVVPRIVGGEE